MKPRPVAQWPGPSLSAQRGAKVSPPRRRAAGAVLPAACNVCPVETADSFNVGRCKQPAKWLQEEFVQHSLPKGERGAARRDEGWVRG